MTRAQASGPLIGLSGTLIAALGAVCGIGGGLFGVPLLHYVFGVPLRRAVATTLALVAASSSSATVSEALHPGGALYWGLIAALTAAALAGTSVGFFIAKRISTVRLKAVFCVVLLVAGVRIVFKASGGPPLEGFVPGAGDYLMVAGFGFFAGIVVPLLGVGGGLIIVPSLLLGLPEIGYLGARASALGMASVTSVRSLLKYTRVGLVDWSTARWFGGGALIGASTGVWLVHFSLVAEIGQVLLGVILCVASVRFGVDVSRARRAVAETSGH